MEENYNPDVLNCLANLSSDEVFTPPNLANKILDLLPPTLWSNKDAKFLDPVCKSGVFLREIAKRLMKGLEKEIPDRQKRLNHIFQNQLYGIAITELTSLLSRRSVYCSKMANGKYSVCDSFNSPEGNIIFHRIYHLWKNGKCSYCGASQAEYDREDVLETHAYQLIHTDKLNKIFNNMKFDVVVGNPPYQLNDGGGTGSSAKPIYHLFIEQAKKLNPRYLSMIIPSRWYSGGKGLDDFRAEMLNDSRISQLYDFADSRDCFPGVDIAGGVCYFLWDKEHKGKCEVHTIKKSEDKIAIRKLNEFENFIRDNLAMEIVKKVIANSESFVDSIVSSRQPFGIAANGKPEKVGDLVLLTSKGDGRISSSKIITGKGLINKWKILISKTSNDHAGQPDKDGKRRILSRVEIMPPKTICSESYLIVGSFKDKHETQNMMNYLTTKFCRFLIGTILLTQNITKSKFVFVPNLSMDKVWTDKLLYKKYKLTEEEIDFIESTIRQMELKNGR